MISRYSIYAPPEDLGLRYGVETPDNCQIRYNAAPTHLLPVITHAAPNGFSIFYWGTSPGWAKSRPVGQKLINTEAESITEKAGSRRALESRRCLVPANNYFGWKSISKKAQVPYCISVADQVIFSFAGLWEEYEDEGNEPAHTFSIITVSSNPSLMEISSRMPAILLPSAQDVWMDPGSTKTQLLEVLIPYPETSMSFHPVSSQVNSPIHDGRQLIEPSQPIDQFGNYSLFE